MDTDTAPELSAIERTRRAQIVACTIETIAELGYSQASLAQIARRAGISKGVILYHFAGKDALIEQVVEAVYAAGAASVLPPIDAVAGPRAKLHAFIAADLAFHESHRTHIRALQEIWRSCRPAPAIAQRRHAETVTGLEAFLRWGQESGAFRPFDTHVMAAALRAALDAAAESTTPDLAARTAALIDLFDRATRP